MTIFYFIGKMGIKDLLKITRKLLKLQTRNCYDKLCDEELGNRKIGVDMSVYIHILFRRVAFHH